MIRNVVKIMRFQLGIIAIFFFILIYPNNIVKADSEEDFIIKDGVLLEYNGNAKNAVITEGVTEIDEWVFSESTFRKY